MQLNLQSSLLTFLDISKKRDFKKPSSWPNIRKKTNNNSIRLLVDDRYPVGFVATVTGGYSVDIDGEPYNDYNSSAQFSVDNWSNYTDTEGYVIDYPTGATKAHIIDIYPQIENENITAFHCSRVASSGNEEQGVLWAHFNLVNAINLSKGFAYTEYYNDLLTAVTAKKNLIIANGLDYCFYNALSLEYLPYIDYSNVSDMTNFITNASNLNIDIDIYKNNTITKIDCYGSSSYAMTGFKELRVSNEAPFNNATSPQINVSYTGMDRAALTTLFNDLPYNVGYTVTGSPTITEGVVSGFSSSNFLTLPVLPSIPEEGKFAFTFKRDSAANQTLFDWQYTNSFPLLLRTIDTAPHLQWQDADDVEQNLLIDNYILVADTSYNLGWKFENGTMTLTLYDNNGEVLATKSKSSTSIINTHFAQSTLGAAGSSNVWQGSINLNNTYVKINGKYWFKGQAAMTKTINVVGCTGTSELTADDKAIATDKGWSLTLE